MSHLLKLSEAASLALHVMALLAGAGDGVVSTRAAAERLGVSENHLAKVFQRLARAGLVASQRGPTGGFRLGRRPEEISLLEIYETIEGPLARSGCLLGRPVCRDGHCILGQLMNRVDGEARNYFSSAKLADLKEAFKEGADHAHSQDN